MKRKQQIYLIIVVAVLIFAIASSTYAFLNLGDRSYGGNIPLGTTTDMGATFTAYSTGNIDISASIDDMLPPETTADINSTAIKNQTANITVTLDSSNRDDATTCTYDLVWVWDSEDQYKTPSVALPYSHPSGKTFNYEFSVRVDNVERDLSKLNWNGNRAVIATKSMSVSKGESNMDEYKVYVRLYNLPVAQKALDGKNFKAHIEVSEAKCRDTKTLELVSTENSSKTLANVIKAQYKVDGDNDLYYHDGKGTYTNANLEAGDNSYRYSGADPKNYVCFGSDAEICPEDNLYRIIGIFDGRVKLIKATPAKSNLLGTNGDYYNDTTYYWYRNSGNQANSNLFGNSGLSGTNLNSNFVNNIDSTGYWRDAIDTTSWIRSGMKWNKVISNNAKNMYDYEVASSCSSCTDKATISTGSQKIGLMYVSDYMYAASPESWTLQANSSTTNGYNLAQDNNWLYTGNWEWTVSKLTDNTYQVFIVGSSVSNAYAYNNTYSVRPTFYLRSNVNYVSGSGAKDDPMRISFTKYFAANLIDGYKNGTITTMNSSYDYTSSGNNYVVFSGDTSTKYYIVDVNSRTNVRIKTTSYYGSAQKWHSSNTTDSYWGNNSLYTYLNGTYLNSLSTTKRNMINSVSLISTGEYKAWMKPSQTMWTRSVYYNTSTGAATGNAYYINTSGNSSYTSKSSAYYIYPLIYLREDVKLLSGSGTSSDPYVISR